jgi:Ni,Fe-hydrogenase maturation factor
MRFNDRIVVMKRKIYICGNPLVDEDSMPFRILPQLRAQLPEIDFMDFDPTENFPQEDPLYIIDTVINAPGVMVLKDLNQLGDAPHYSAHDADLAFHLKWLEKMGKLPALTIFGVPAEGEEKSLIKEVVGLIQRELDL